MSLSSPDRGQIRGRWVAIALLWGACVARAGGDDRPSVAEWVAADAVAYVEIQNAGPILDHLYSSEFRTLLEASPQIKKQLSDKSVRDIQLALEFVGRGVGMSASRLVRELTDGGVVAAFEAPDRAILVLRARNSETLQKAHGTFLELARQDAQTKKQPDPVKTVDRDGTTIYRMGDNFAHALLGNALVLSNKVEMVERAIDRSHGKGEFSALAADAGWKARREQVGPDVAGWAYVRLDRVRKLAPDFLKPKPQDAPGSKLIFGPWFEATQSAEWALLRLDAASKSLGLQLDLPQPAGVADGALAKYRPADGQGAIPPVKPPGTLLTASLWRDWSAIWEVRDQLLPPEALQGLAQLDSVAGQFFGGRDFGSGVLGSLAPEWRLVIVQQNYEQMNPAPDQKLPGGVLLLNLRPEDEEFPVRLQAAFQSFVGLVNIGNAQQKGPPLMLGSEVFEGVTISKSSYVPPKDAEAGKPVDTRFNFSPCAAQVGNTFVLSSSLDAAKAVIHELKASTAPPQASPFTIVAEADGKEAARLVEVNKGALVMRNMLEKGNSKEAAEGEIELLARALRYLNRGRLSIDDRGSETKVRLDFDLGR